MALTSTKNGTTRLAASKVERAFEAARVWTLIFNVTMQWHERGGAKLPPMGAVVGRLMDAL